MGGPHFITCPVMPPVRLSSCRTQVPTSSGKVPQSSTVTMNAEQNKMDSYTDGIKYFAMWVYNQLHEIVVRN